MGATLPPWARRAQDRGGSDPAAEALAEQRDGGTEVERLRRMAGHQERDERLDDKRRILMRRIQRARRQNVVASALMCLAMTAVGVLGGIDIFVVVMAAASTTVVTLTMTWLIERTGWGLRRRRLEDVRRRVHIAIGVVLVGMSVIGVWWAVDALGPRTGSLALLAVYGSELLLARELARAENYGRLIIPWRP
jgi:hypothetical protein